MDANAKLEIEKQLESGETLLWTGIPQQGFLLRPSDAFMIPLSLLWCGGVIFWEAGVIAAEAPLFFVLWGIPFVLVGLYLVVGRFFVDSRARANTYYGLTDRRVIILPGGSSRRIESLTLRTLQEISLEEKADGTGVGTVRFGRPHFLAAFYAGLWWPGSARYLTPCFELIEDARRVHDQVREAQRAAA